MASLTWVSVSCNHRVLTNSEPSTFWPGSVFVTLHSYIGVREQGVERIKLWLDRVTFFHPLQLYLPPWFPGWFQLSEAWRRHLPSGNIELQQQHGTRFPIDSCLCLQLLMAFFNRQLTDGDDLVFSLLLLQLKDMENSGFRGTKLMVLWILTVAWADSACVILQRLNGSKISTRCY